MPEEVGTLQEALEMSLIARRKGHKKSARTVALMRGEVERHAKELLTKRMRRITHADIAAIHRHVTENNGPITANRIVRHLSSVFGVADVPFPLDRKWWRENRNDEEGRIDPVHDLAAAGAKMRALENRTLANFYRLVAITGLRRTDALELRWADIEHDGRKGWLYRPSPKGGPRRAFWLPVTTQMRAIFDAQEMRREGEWVFPGHVHGEHIKDPLKRGQMPTPHQFRVTYDTRALDLGCPEPVVAALLNHKLHDKSMTKRYYRVTDAKLVEWAQRIADSIWADLNGSNDAPANSNELSDGVHHVEGFA